MPTSCPICEQPIPSTAAHCAVCGFPTGLAIEGLRSLAGNGGEVGESREPSGPAPSGAASPPVRSKVVPAAPSPEAELNAAISRDLRERMELVQELGHGPDVTSELCQAALGEAEGRVAEALAILRSAQRRLEHETEQVLRQRLALLTERREVLDRTGARFAVGPDFERLSAAVEAGEREEAVGLLLGVERRLGQFESDWKGLQGLLAQIEGLRNEAAELGLPLGEISSELEAIRDRLSQRELSEYALDTFAQEAAQTLMLLHEAIPASLEEELGRTETTLNQLPDGHAWGAVARKLPLEAGRHLKKGRLAEAMPSLRELRGALAELRKESAPETGPAPPIAPVADSDEEDELLEKLLKKARSLAARVRTLPPESEAARDAAVQIREATDLLRTRQLKEADLTLTRLMRLLANEPPRT